MVARGRIRLHRTHQSGLSVDFMVPVLDKLGRSVPLPTTALNKFGYDIEFDKDGKFGDLTIDFEAIAEHLRQLHLGGSCTGRRHIRTLLCAAQRRRYASSGCGKV